jgi:protein SCO1/2
MKLWNLMAVVLSLAGGLSPLTAAHTLHDVEASLQQEEKYAQLVNQPAPDFALNDLEGRRWRLGDFAGKAVILNFVYARCQDICPAHMAVIAELQRMVNTARMQEVVQFITIATDTAEAEKTAEAMATYPQRYGLDPANWLFLYGGAEAPGAGIQLADQYGLKFVPTGDDAQMHAVVTHVIDRKGQMRARFHGLRFAPIKLLGYANTLAFDVHDEPQAADTRAIAGMPWLGAGALLATALLAFGWYRRTRATRNQRSARR